MKRRLLNIKKTKAVNLVFTIDTLLDVGTDFTIPTSLAETYIYDVDWGDASVSLSQTGNVSHNYASEGTYEITIKGDFPKFFFNNSGDRLKITSVDSWGDLDYSTEQQQAFYGCENLSSIAEDIEWINAAQNCGFMFHGSALTSLPNAMTLDACTNSQFMFFENNLTSLPSGMVLPLVTNGQFMFRSVPLSSLPTGMTLANLTDATGMFRSVPITSLPSGMLLDNLINAATMFSESGLTSLPSGMILGNVENGSFMFRNLALTSLPNFITLASLTNGIDMFNGTTINTSDYSVLINNIDSSNNNTGVEFHGGNSKYNAGVVANHDNLTITKNWTIIDGGLE